MGKHNETSVQSRIDYLKDQGKSVWPRSNKFAKKRGCSALDKCGPAQTCAKQGNQMKNTSIDLKQQLALAKKQSGPVVLSQHFLKDVSGGAPGDNFYMNCPTGGPCDGPGQGFIRR
jgi:hypothetical protein